MSMSIGMAQGMNALIGINSQLQDLQAQALSGKKINNASDGLASYLSAKTYSDRSNRLSNVNDTLSGNMQTIKAAQTGLNSIRKTITDTLDTLKAASQTQASVAAVGQSNQITGTSTAGTQIGFGFGIQTQGGVNINNVAITAATALVNPAIAGNAGASTTINGQKLVQGQIFTINNTTIRIAAAGDAVNGDGSGSSVANAKNVTTIGEFLGAVQSAFGVNGSMSAVGALQNLNINMAGNGGKVVITNNNQAANANNSITFTQNAGASVNLQTLFAGARAQPANATSYDSDDQGALIGGNSFTMTGNTHSVSGGTAGQTADPRRAAAAKSFKLAIDQINQYLRSASVSGTNLLNGDTLKVTFDEKGTSTTFQVQDGNNGSLTFSAASLGLVNTTTGTSPDVALNFATNDDAALDAQGNSTVGLNAAINKLTSALGTLSLGDSQVAQFQATTQNRVDFNKSIVSLLDDAANNLTAADMSQVAAQTAALQVQQSFAQTIMANTKQSDQSILQLLR